MLNLTASRHHFFFAFLRFRASLLGPVSAILGTKWCDTNLGICARDFFSFLGRARHLQNPKCRQKEPQRRPEVLKNHTNNRSQIIQVLMKTVYFVTILFFSFLFVWATTFRVIFQKPQFLPSIIALNRLPKCLQNVTK